MIKTYEVKPYKNFKAEVEIPGSKSVANRAMIIAAQAKGRTILKNMLFSDDTKYMIEALRKIGHKIEVDEKNKTVIVESLNERIFSNEELFVGNAGTAMRFLPTYISTGQGEVVLTGIERMKERPIKDLVDALAQVKTDIEYMEKEGYPPIKVKAKGLNGGEIVIKGNKSSQYLTSLLLSAPYAKEDLKIVIDGPLVSIPYVNITTTMMKDFGVEVINNENKEFLIKSGQEYKGREYIVEGDCSSASYFFCNSSNYK